MSQLTPEIAGDIVAACRAAADDITAALTRALEGQFMGVTIAEAAAYDAKQPPAGFDGPGLAVLFRFGEVGAVAVLPEASGLLPAWYAEPDASGKSRLSTLAQELSALLLPASLAADEFSAFRIEQLSDAITRAEIASSAMHLPMTFKGDDKEGQLSLLWPVAKPGALKPVAGAGTADQANGAAADQNLERWPKFTRSLFKVQVPVSVKLASQKQTVQEIIEIVPGSIIKFDKSCDELLDVVVGDQAIAAGEVVKVGDKFGLRIRHMLLPQEQFIAIKASIPA